MIDFTQADARHTAHQLERMTTNANTRIFTSVELIDAGDVWMIKAVCCGKVVKIPLRKAEKVREGQG